MSQAHPLAGGKAPDFASHIGVAQKALVPKRHAITGDYTILTRSLGVGVNGKVLECIHKGSGERRALKVQQRHSPVSLLSTARHYIYKETFQLLAVLGQESTYMYTYVQVYM